MSSHSEILSGMLLAFGALIYTFWPENVFASQRQKTRLDYLLERKDQLYENLRDLNFEFKAGKLPDVDYQSIKASLEEERKRIIESAEQEIESFGAAAQRDLKRFAANLAIERAAQQIHLGADADRILVQNFTADLAGMQNKGGQN